MKHVVPQDSVLGPALFSIQYNSIHSAVKHSSCTLFADDTEIYSSDSNISRAVDNVNEDLVCVEKWLVENEMVAHPGKFEAMKIGSRPALKNTEDVVINLNSHKLNEVNTYKYLGVHMDRLLTWNDHFSHMRKKFYPKLCLLNRTSSFLPRHVLLSIYKQTILPFLDYGCIVWLDCTKQMSDKIERLQNKAMRTMLRADRRTCSQDMRNKLSLLTLHNRRRFLRFQLIFKIVNNFKCPEQLVSYLPSRSSMHNKNFRDNTLLHFPKEKSDTGHSTFQNSATRDWNSLPKAIRGIASLNPFKSAIFKYLLNLDVVGHRCSVK